MGEASGFQALSLGFRAPGCQFLTSHAAWRGFLRCSEFQKGLGVFSHTFANKLSLKKWFTVTCSYCSLERVSDLCSHILFFPTAVSRVLSLVCFAAPGKTGKFFFLPGSSHLCSVFFFSHCWSSAHLLFQCLGFLTLIKGPGFLAIGAAFIFFQFSESE